MLHYKAGVLSLLVLYAAQAEAEGIGGMLKGLKEKLDATTQQTQPKNTKTTQDAIETSLDKDTPVPEQANASSPVISQVSPAEQAAPVAKAVFDFKGIKLNMPVSEVLAIAKSNLSSNSHQATCQTGKVSMQQEDYFLGDTVMVCREFQYFGQSVSNLKAYFIDGKLSYLVMGKFYSEGDQAQELPAVFQALAEKYSIKPKFHKEPKRLIGVYEFAATFMDTNGSELFANGELRQDLSGNMHKDVVIGFQIENYRQIQRQRLALMDEHTAKEQKAETQRKQRDL